MTAKVVAIEGIDGAGKSHLCRLLVERLARRGLRVRRFDKHDAGLGDDFAGRRMAALRATIWPSEAEPPLDPLGTQFYLHLLAAWFAGLGRLMPILAGDADIVVTDGSFYRVVAKAHARDDLCLAWLQTLFEKALRPDHVLLLDIDPAQAWARRSAFKATEIGRWDGHHEDARSGFCAYQGVIRSALLGFAERDGWTVVGQDARTSPDDAARAAEQALAPFDFAR